MPFNINEFKSNVLQNGLLKPNLYWVNFLSSKWFGTSGLYFYTDSVTLPATDLETMTIQRYGYGPSSQYAFRPVFTNLSIDFMVEATAWNAISAALSAMTDVTNFMGYKNINDSSSSNPYMIQNTSGTNPYEVAYKDTYKFELRVYMYNEKADTILEYVFRDCFAKQIGSIQLGWGNNDQLLKLPLTFAYTDYSIGSYDQSARSDGIRSISPIQNVFGMEAFSFSPMNIPREIANIVNVVNNRLLNSVGGTYNQIF